MSSKTQPRAVDLAAKLSSLTKPVEDIGESLLLSASYDGDVRRAILKFYEPKEGRFWLWQDNTGHRPYCFTRLPMSELRDVRARKDVIEIIEDERLDLLNDAKAKLRRIVTTDPLAIGGGNDSIRDMIKAWEADIKYYENFAYDRGLRMGTYYTVSGGEVIPARHEPPESVRRSLEEVTGRNPPEFVPYLREWAELLGEPLVDLRRIAMDIEVANEAGRLPDKDNPTQPVTAVSFYNDVEKVVYLLRDGKDTGGLEKSPFAYEVFEEETDLLRAVMSKILDYPVLVTFNGDDFDLRYLQHRAEFLGVKEEEDPIQLERVAASLKHGIHIDLYQFFRNRSIQVYAFGNKYSEHTLNGISESLLNKSKIEFEGEISGLPLAELAKYCLNDSMLTYELTSMRGAIVMKLLLVISRIGKMPMNDVSRLGVSNWIRSMLFFEHRRIGALIPRQDELNEKGGATSQAIIKGKKYKGGFVIEPKPGVYFDVSVLDFASLYPSLIKVHNLSYETVNCPHPECKANAVPDTSSWVCTRRKGIVSLVTGSLRDLRVAHYKPLAKDPSVPEGDRDLYNVVSQGLKVFLNACFTGDTYVVTPSGIKNIKDFRVGDKVVNVDPGTLEVEIDEVAEVQEFDYKGDMYHFRDAGTVDLEVTPNHRMLVMDRKRSSKTGAVFRTAEEVYRLSNMAIPRLKSPLRGDAAPRRVSMLPEAQELAAEVHFYPNLRRLSNWFRELTPSLRSKIRSSGAVHRQKSKVEPRLGSHYTLPAALVTEEDIDSAEAAGGFVRVGTKKSAKIPVRFDAVQFAELCGWFVAEGSTYLTSPKLYESGHVRGKSSGVTVTQSYGKGNLDGILYRTDISRLLESLSLKASTDSKRAKHFKVASSVLHRWMVKNCYAAAAEEHRAATKKIPEFVFSSKDTMEGFLESAYKGDGSSRQTLYSTKSRWLAEGLVVLLTSLGSKTRMVWDDGTYRVHFANTSTKLTYSGKDAHRHVSREDFAGKVYCITTAKNHTVFAGKNGKFVPVGQSYGVLGFETFAFYCLPVAEATAALGRDAITRTVAKCRELGIEVLYGDSVTGDRCVTLLDPAGRLKVLPISRFFDSVPLKSTRSDGKDEASPHGWKALSVNPMTKRVDFKPVNAVIRHKAAKKIYRVREKWGVTRVTEDHSLLATDGVNTRFATPANLGRGHLVRADSIPPLEEITEVDVYQVMRGLRYKKKYKERTKVLEAHSDGEWVWFGWTERREQIKVKRRIRVGTPEFRSLVELLGAYVPEGSSSTPETTKSRMGASIANGDVGWLSHLRDCYLSLFEGAAAKVVPSNPGERTLSYRVSGGMAQVTYRDYTHKLQMMNNTAAAFFRAFAGQSSKGKKIPDFVFHVPDEYKILFLDNLVKGDGSKKLGDSHTAANALKDFRYETASNELASGLSTLLSTLGVKHSVEYRAPKRTYRISTSTRYGGRGGAPRVEPEPYQGYVYDLSVADYHTFVDSCGSVVLKNTDSTFLHSPTKEQIATITKWVDSELGIELDLDKVYRYVAFSTRKKNYFGVLPDGTVDIKGLTGRKSQTPEYLKKVFYQTLDILSSVKSSEDFERARGETRTLLTGMINSIKGKKVPVEDLAFTVMMGKPTDKYNGTTPQHVRAAMQLQEKGKEVKAGEIIAYVKTKSPPYVKPAELARADEIDADKYIEYAHSMFDQLLDALDFSFDEIMGATTLDLFWSS